MTNFEKIQSKLKSLPAKKMDGGEQAFIQHYLGTSKQVLGIKIGEVLKIAKETLKELENSPIEELIGLLDQLFFANTFEEHAIGGKIFTLIKPAVRSQIPFSVLEGWLSKARGWVETDVICQSSFTTEEVLARWAEWEEMIKKFRMSSNISLRRASLVLQNPSARKSNEPKIRRLAFETIDTLKKEKEILITKAVSWLLRSLVDQDKEEVRQYLITNEDALPRIAYRETLKKIETGKKTSPKKQ